MRSFLLLFALMISGCGGYAQTKTALERTAILTNWHQNALTKLEVTLTETALFGQGPCNRFSAQRNRMGDHDIIGPIASTRMTCPDISAETKLFRDLQTIDQIRMTDTEMIFYHKSRQIFRFSLMP